MSTQEWTQLVQQVDRLIHELKQAKTEIRHWRTRAMELESLHLRDDRNVRLEEQAKERELERLRREHGKTVTTLERILSDLANVQNRITEMGEE